MGPIQHLVTAIRNLLKLTHEGIKRFRLDYSLFRGSQFCSRPFPVCSLRRVGTATAKVLPVAVTVPLIGKPTSSLPRVLSFLPATGEFWLPTVTFLPVPFPRG